MEVADKFLYGLQVTAIGMGLVFLILYLLSVILELMDSVFQKQQNQSHNIVEETFIRKEQYEPVPSSDTKLVAAITAAISAYDIKGTPFKIARITRTVPNTPIWGVASRLYK